MRGLLFLCIANSVRSQMAEGLAREKFGDRICVQSAGTQPSEINPLAVAVMREIGIDISSQRSKNVDEIELSSVDLVVTLCAEANCPTSLNLARQLHWLVHDPVEVTGSNEERLESFRLVRNEIWKKLLTLDFPDS